MNTSRTGAMMKIKTTNPELDDLQPKPHKQEKLGWEGLLEAIKLAEVPDDFLNANERNQEPPTKTTTD